MRHLRPAVDQLRGCRVLVGGDIVLDEYLKGEVSRISPEAPVPVLEVRRQSFALGGAANAAANIQALGGATTLVGVVGRDDTATMLGERLATQGIENAAVVDPQRPTSKKTRLVAQDQQIVRVDHEKRTPVDAAALAGLEQAIDRAIRSAQALVIM